MLNVLANPGDARFRRLRCASAIIGRLLASEPAAQLLELFGFVSGESDGERLLVLPATAPGAPSVYEAVQRGGVDYSVFEVIMPPSEEAQFRRELVSDFDKLIFKTCNVDLERCHAWHGDECLVDGKCRDVSEGRVASCSNDLRFVLDNVRHEISFEEVNKRVIGCMRDWAVAAGRQALADIKDDDARRASDLQLSLARLLKDCGQLASAEVLARECIEVRRRELDSEHRNTHYSMTLLGGILIERGQLDEAEEVLRGALEMSQRSWGRTCSLT